MSKHTFLAAMLVLLPLISVPFTASAKEPYAPVILIDPGHGGIDGGTQSNDGRVLEKDLNLLIATELAGQLKAEGFEVAMTRDKDEDVTKFAPTDRGWGRHKRDLFGRVEATRRHSSVMLISIHGNHGTSRNMGAHVFYNPKSADSYLLANDLQQQLNEATSFYYLPRKGGSYFILKQSRIPSVLIEYGYLSNPVEVSRLMEHVYRRKLTDSICKGVSRYLTLHHFLFDYSN